MKRALCLFACLALPLVALAQDFAPAAVVMDTSGPAGPKGDTGAQGVQGVQGVPGPTGPTGAPGAAGAVGPAGTNGVNGTPGQNATTTALANATTPGLYPSADFLKLAALPTIIRASPTVAVPAIMLVSPNYTVTLAVPGAQVGGVVTVNCPDATLAGSVVYPLPPVTVAGQVSIPLKAIVAISAGNRTFSVAVVNP